MFCFSTDRKDKMEAENQGLVLTFGSHLDHSLKSLHKAVVGSISQQNQQLRCMEEHVCSFIASKCEVKGEICFCYSNELVTIDYSFCPMIFVPRQTKSWK